MSTLGTHRSFSLQRAFYPYEILLQSSPKIVHDRRHLGIYLAAWRCMRDVIEFNLKFGGKLEHSTLPFAVMPFCSAPYCSNRSQRDGKKGISFHRLPVKRKNLAKQWLIKLGRDKKFLPKLDHLYVCSDHFTEDCFEVDHRHNLLGGKTRKRKKKPGAVPTIFKNSSFMRKRAASERRLATKRRKEVRYISFFK